MSNNMIAAWIKALKSGRYQQGYGQMYNPETGCYCATGVLGEVLADAGLVQRNDYDGSNGLYGRDYVIDGHMNAYAFKRITGLNYEYLKQIELLNDDGRSPFPIIAHAIAMEAVMQGLLTREEALSC